jgi:hypothetical protein
VITSFNVLRVCGQDAAKLEAAITPYRSISHYHWECGETRLEDVFVWLVGKHRDTRYDK